MACPWIQVRPDGNAMAHPILFVAAARPGGSAQDRQWSGAILPCLRLAAAIRAEGACREAQPDRDHHAAVR